MSVYIILLYLPSVMSVYIIMLYLPSVMSVHKILLYLLSVMSVYIILLYLPSVMSIHVVLLYLPLTSVSKDDNPISDPPHLFETCRFPSVLSHYLCQCISLCRLLSLAGRLTSYLSWCSNTPCQKTAAWWVMWTGVCPTLMSPTSRNAVYPIPPTRS